MTDDNVDPLLPADTSGADREIFENDDAALRSALAELSRLGREEAPEPTGELADIFAGSQKVNFVAAFKKKAPPFSGGIAGILIASVGLTGVAAASPDVRDFIFESTIGVATHVVDDFAQSPLGKALGSSSPAHASSDREAATVPNVSAAPAPSTLASDDSSLEHPHVQTADPLEAAGLPSMQVLPQASEEQASVPVTQPVTKPSSSVTPEVAESKASQRVKQDKTVATVAPSKSQPQASVKSRSKYAKASGKSLRQNLESLYEDQQGDESSERDIKSEKKAVESVIGQLTDSKRSSQLSDSRLLASARQILQDIEDEPVKITDPGFAARLISSLPESAFLPEYSSGTKTDAKTGAKTGAKVRAKTTPKTDATVPEIGAKLDVKLDSKLDVTVDVKVGSKVDSRLDLGNSDSHQ